jgi:uncharacterized protein (TIGR02453 family)
MCRPQDVHMAKKTIKKAQTPRFSLKTISFLEKAKRQKKQDWLVTHREEYEELLLFPLQELARKLKTELVKEASGYHFPQKGIGRLKRPSHKAAEYGSLYKSYVSYTASRPSGSRFDHNPSLFFMIHPEDPKDTVLIAGGLYMPSSRQTRSIREAIAEDNSPFVAELERLFKSKDFSRQFPGGFSDERIASRPPRGFDPLHPRMDWLKLQGFFVWRSYPRKLFISKEFTGLVVRDCRQILRLNHLLEAVIQGKKLNVTGPKKTAKALSDRLEDVQAPVRLMDF